MPRLYLMRHGIAGRGGNPPLTPEGEAIVRRQAAAMSRLDLGIEAIYTSPLARARQTAVFVAEGIGFTDRVRTLDALRPGCRMTSLTALGRSERAILLVGHAPDMGLVAAALSGIQGMIPFERGAIACVAMDCWPVAPPGILVFLLPAEILCAMADW